MKFELNEERNGYTLVSGDDVPTVVIPREYDGRPVTRIEDMTFNGCTSLTSVTIPDSVTSIGVEAFSVCASLKSITIGNSVTNIGAYAFEDCTLLKDVYYNGDKASWDKITFDNEYANPLYYGATLHTKHTKANGEKANGEGENEKKYKRLTPMDEVELINDVLNKDGDRTNLLRCLLKLKAIEDFFEQIDISGTEEFLDKIPLEVFQDWREKENESSND